MCNKEYSYLASKTENYDSFNEYLNAFYNDARLRWQHQGGEFLTGVYSRNEIKQQIRWRIYKALKWDYVHVYSGFVLVPPSNIPELWIDRDVGSDDYREDYKKFLSDIVNVSDSESALDKYDLDHVYPFSSAHRKNLVRYMLLLPVLKPVNRSYASLEQARSGDMRGQKLTHYGDYFTFAKAMGISAPSISKNSNQVHLETFIDRLIDKELINKDARETELNALLIIYDRIKSSAQASRIVASNSPLPPRGRRNITTGKITY